MPRAGLAVMPERASEPPHSSAEVDRLDRRGLRLRATGIRDESLDERLGGAGRCPRAAAAGQRDELDAVGARARGRGQRGCRRHPGRSGRSRRRSHALRSRAGRAATRAMSTSDPARPSSRGSRDRAGMAGRDLLGRRAGGGVQGQHEHVVAEAPAPVAPLIADEVHASHAHREALEREDARAARLGRRRRAGEHGHDLRPQLVDGRVRREIEVVAERSVQGEDPRRRSPGRRRNRPERRRAPGRRR